MRTQNSPRRRNLEPENIFLRPDGTPVLVDFGIAGGFSGAAGREAQEARALEHARALLDPRQQRLPDALASLLSGAVEAQAQGQSALARSRLARALGVARRLGYL